MTNLNDKITEKSIKNVDSQIWQDTAFSQLNEQLTTLQERYMIAISMNKPEMAHIIKLGIDRLTFIIQNKNKDNKKI